MDSKTNMIYRIGDWVSEGLDLAFVENNYFMGVEVEVEGYDGAWFGRVVECAFELWMPEQVEISILDGDGRHKVERVDLRRASHDGLSVETLKAVLLKEAGDRGREVVLDSGVEGWARVAAPTEVDWKGGLRAVDADGMGPRHCEVRAAASLGGEETIWVRMDPPNMATHVAIHYVAQEVCRVSFKLGCVYFRPRYEDGTAWGEVQLQYADRHQRLIAEVEGRLEGFGFRRMEG